MQLQVLGPVQATDKGESVALGGPRQRAVLALLVAFANQPVSSDRLIDEIWGDEPPPQARNSLQAMISNLRKALHTDERFAIERSGRSYQLTAPEDGIDSLLFASKVESARGLIETDIDRGIGELSAALELWQGDPYSDVDEADTLRADGARLDELRLRALEIRIEAEMSAGHSADVVGELEQLVDREPLREGLHQLLMLALVDSGRQAEALRVAGRLRQTLAAELGIDPSPELVQLEQQILDQSVETPAAPVREVANPYRGLESFTEADADRFFGRDKLTELLVDRLAEDVEGYRLLAVVGASGSGKSSVVRAGLIPALRRGAVPGSENWVVVQMVPGSTPLRDLEAALLRIAVNPPPTLLEQLARDDLGLRDAVERILPHDAELLLVIDQFEELFTTADPDESAQLINAIVGAVTASESRVRVVVTLRADFYDRPLVHPGLAPLLAGRQETVVAMTPDELSEAVVGPAAQVGVEVEPALVGSIIGDATGQPGALPLLQYTMTELFERWSGGGLTLEDYESFGGLRGAIGRQAEAVFTGLDRVGQRGAQILFLQLVTLLEADEATRRRAFVDDLPADVGADVIDALVGARLVSLDQDADGRPTVEVAHEALLGEWPRLGRWVEEGREDIRTHLRLREAAREWTEANRQPDYLLSGQKLAAFEAWSATTDRVVAATEADLLERSIAARDDRLQRQATKRRRTLTALAAAAVGAVLLAGFAVFQANSANEERDRANLRGLTASALSVAPADSELGVLLAIEAVEREANDATLEALHRTLAGHYLVTSLPAPTGGAAFIGEAVGVLDADGTIAIYDISTAAATEVRRIGEPGWIATEPEFPDFTREALGPLWMQATSDGSVLFVAAADGSLIAVDVPSGTEMWRVPISVTPPEFAVSRDGQYVAARGYLDAWVEFPPPPTAGGLYEVATGEKIFDFGTCCTAALAIIDDPEPRVLVEQARGAETFAAWIDIDDGAVVDAREDVFSFVRVAADRDISISMSFRVAGEVVISTRGELVSYYEGHEAQIWDLELSPGASLAASASVDGTAQVWDPRSRKQIRVIRLGTGAVWDVEFSPDDIEAFQLLTTGSHGVAQVWNLSPLADAEVIGVEEDFNRFGLDDFAELRNFAAFTAADRLLTIELSKPNESPPKVYDLADQSILEFPPFLAESVAVVPGTELVAFARQGNVTFVDLTDGTNAGRLDVTDGGAESRYLVFSPSGESFALGTESGRIELVDRASGSAESIEAGAQLRAVLFGEATGLVTVHRDGAIKLWGENPADQPVDAIDTDSVSISAAATGSRLVVGDLLGGWTMVDTVQTDVVTAERTAHRAPVVTVAAHGDTFATGDFSGVIKLWDQNTGEERMTLPDLGASVQELAFNSDGSRLVVATREGVRVFALDATELLEIAKGRVTRILTEAECEQYLAAFGCG